MDEEALPSVITSHKDESLASAVLSVSAKSLMEQSIIRICYLKYNSQDDEYLNYVPRHIPETEL